MIKKLFRFFLRNHSAKELFEEIYFKNFWQDKQSKSGPGSNLVQTEVIRYEIPKLLEALEVNIFVDAPCGDFFFMNTIAMNIRKYIGVDIVAPMIALNQKNFSNEPRRCKACKSKRQPGSGDRGARRGPGSRWARRGM